MGDHLELSNIDAIERCSLEGFPVNPFTDVVISRHLDGELIGAVVFSDYVEASINISIYGWHPRWISREFIAVCMDYPFNQLGVERLFSRVREDLARALRINLRFGLKPIALIPDVYPGGVGVLVMKMERHECRWLKLDPHRVYRMNGRLAA